MSRTDLDAETLARSLRAMAGDGGIEWVMEPMQASVLLDIADALDESAKLRELVRDMFYAVHPVDRETFLTNVAELGAEVYA